MKIEKKNTNAKVFVNATGLDNGYKSEAEYYTFTDMMTAYERADTYFETFTVSHYHSFINVTEDLGSVDVKIYRNKMNNVKINLQTLADAKHRGDSASLSSFVMVDYEDED